MWVALLLLDSEGTLEEGTQADLIKYIEAFFCIEVRVVEVPAWPTAPKGWKALVERIEHPLRSRQPRPGSPALGQLSSTDLLACLRRLRLGAAARDDGKHHGVEIDDAECIVGITNCEFFHSTAGLRPEDSVPEESTRERVASHVRDRVAACSVLGLDAFNKSGSDSRARFKHLLGLLSHTLLTILGLRTSQDQRCLCYHRCYDPERTEFCLSAAGDEALLRRVRPSASRNELVELAQKRYQDLAEVLDSFGSKMDPVKLCRRVYLHFEEERDWYRVAAEMMLDVSQERKGALSEGQMKRQRSLTNCLAQCHEGQPPRTLRRTFVQPLLKRTCMVDMTLSAPYRHESGEMGKWLSAVINRQHKPGGVYAEFGGSLRPKRVGSYVDCGLNASFTRKETRTDGTVILPELKVRSRSATCLL